MSLCKRKFSSVVDSLHDFLNNFEEASKCLQYHLTKPKVEIEYTNSKDNLFAHYCDDIIEHPKRQIRLSFRFGNNNFCVFSIEKSELHDNQFVRSEIFSVNFRDIHHLRKTGYNVANKYEIIESNYDV